MTIHTIISTAKHIFSFLNVKWMVKFLQSQTPIPCKSVKSMERIPEHILARSLTIRAATTS